jgi:hypothetical protein
VRDVTVLADGDDPGEAAARDCAWRWKRMFGLPLVLSRKSSIARHSEKLESEKTAAA